MPDITLRSLCRRCTLGKYFMQDISNVYGTAPYKALYVGLFKALTTLSTLCRHVQGTDHPKHSMLACSWNKQH
jgi:hypothetical protein